MRPRLADMVFALFLLALAGPGLAGDDQFLVEAELWIDGVQRGSPRLLIASGIEADVMVAGPNEVWRLTVEVEPVEDAYAPANTLWLHLAVHQRTVEDWDHLADSLLGVPAGEWATLSVVDGDAESTPETAAVYLRVRTSRAVIPEA